MKTPFALGDGIFFVPKPFMDGILEWVEGRRPSTDSECPPMALLLQRPLRGKIAEVDP
jgi:hypothetical protein